MCQLPIEFVVGRIGLDPPPIRPPQLMPPLTDDMFTVEIENFVRFLIDFSFMVI